jgi:uncharacterized protein (DUF2267 family)/pterin-4a-carbinolamine dehydratase
MEGDNQRRRALARDARERGRLASQENASLGSSKQNDHLPGKKRAGPPPAGGRKPGPEASRRTTPPTAEPSRPKPNPDRLGTAPPSDPLVRRYREVVGEVGRRIGVGFEEARSAAEATVTVTARALGIDDRRRFLDRLPPELHDSFAVDVPYPPRGTAGFIEEVGRISHRDPAVARVQAQAVLSVLAEQDHELVDAVHLPDTVRDLLAPPPAGGGLVGPAGGVPPLTEDELRAALGGLPYWDGNRTALRRTITLPEGNLDRVLARIDLLGEGGARSPRITRDDRENATIVVRSANANAVTAMDVDLAHRVDAVIDEAGGGMASPR